MTVLLLVLAMMLGVWAGVLFLFAGPLAARWREPVLRHPVLVIESDDWGAGPLRQAEALARLAALLQRVRDRSGRPAVMTLGVVLEVPDGARIAASDCTDYHALTLADARFDGVRAAMQDGITAGVFVPQLHGQCHYWPPALLAAAQGDAAVRDWLTDSEPAATEDLPAPLQSRWVDASCLPSRALDPALIRQAVAAEAENYRAVFGGAPRAAVATTFVWNDAVEAAWAQAGVEAIITPGRRATCRNAAGEPDCVDATMLAGERSAAGQTCLVRDVYFEPALGHAPQRLVEGLLARTRQGRACLVETHRFNFLRAPDASLDALETALRAALTACPELRFASPLELAQAMRARDPAWIETQLKPRLAAWRARLDEIPRFPRLARLSGLALPLAWLGARA
jgi:hypothetical protein